MVIISFLYLVTFFSLSQITPKTWWNKKMLLTKAIAFCLFVFMGPGNPVMGHPVFQGFSLKPKRYREGSLSSTGVNGGYEQTNS